MNVRTLFALWLCPALVVSAGPGVETDFHRVALTGQIAPGLSSKITFSDFEYISIADDGRVAFTANINGPGITQTNDLGLWAGFPNEIGLHVHTGDLVPGQTNQARYSYLWAPNVDVRGGVGFLANETASGIAGLKSTSGRAYIVEMRTFFAEVILLITIAKLFGGAYGADHYNGHVLDRVAARVELSGPDVNETNDLAIVAGPPTNVVIVAREGSPAPGTSGVFTFFPATSYTLALAPDGNVAFRGRVSGNVDGIWYGNATNLQAVMFPNLAAPESLRGPGHTFGFFPASENVEVNARGHVAFATPLNGPGLNSTNSEFVVAGPPGNLRVFAQSGQPAPGIPGAVFRTFNGGSSTFSHVLLGSDGAVAFLACYSETGRDFGLWFARTNGATPVLLMRTGQQAPGAPAGAVFTNSFAFLPPVESVYMNARNQIVFRSLLGGPGIAPDTLGIWLAEPDGTVQLVALKGDSVDIGSGMKQLSNVTFGADPEFIAGPEDGRRIPFNDLGEMALVLNFTDFSRGMFIARTGLRLNGERFGNDIRLQFPTLTDKQYRVDYRTNLTAGTWTVLQASVPGTGSEVTVTNAGIATTSTRFYRAVREG